MSSPRFAATLEASRDDLLGVHQRLPREVRYVADLQRWLLSQATLAVHFEYKTGLSDLPISPANLLRFLEGTHVSSRNTTLSFLKEMIHYKLVEPLPSGDRRVRSYLAQPYAEDLIREWFHIHLRALDLMDNGNRFSLSQVRPDLLFHAQPLMTRYVLAEREWSDPPEAVAAFVKADSGSNLLHHLAALAAGKPVVDGKVWIGPMSSARMAQGYLISQSHTGRLFARARKLGAMGWQTTGHGRDCWLAPELVDAYHRWQAVKLSCVARAVADGAVALQAHKP
ncbi:hypothetical protein GCM10007920_09300 [Ciceribacter naphthalenivorans]|uniref:Uncharacterized protein n=3 Tax=Pseudomonadota TaxID=1224 RepID=A0A512HEV5_9HYPH|nr:hypothetical protein RNA01_09100 [Ciceribacter naphthalenivorans]GLR21144.1 hypothetical protein GCM10007920_09300 [Ciceribacter naphthalenivorans]GLT04000.1 hypothetical protein GCM10007926_09300 [Sphingomonas psychrolutea]